MAPLVSVCIPVYNGATYLRDTLESVFAQTFEDLEVVVVDNASTDDTPQILASFGDPRLRVIRNDATVEVYENWTRAVDATTGTYVKLVCADDLLRPTCVERQVEAFRQNGPGVMIVASRRDIINENGHVLIPRRGLRRMSGRIAGPRAIARCVRRGTNTFGEGVAVLARGDAIRAACPWPDEFPYMTDLVMWFRLLAQGDLVAIPETLAAFRAHGTSWSASIASTQALQAQEFFGLVAAAPGSPVTRLELHIGRVRAAILSRLRLLAYLPVVTLLADSLAALLHRLRRSVRR